MQSDVFVELSLILVVATGVAAVMRLLRQPLIIGYILTGLLVGPTFLNLVQSNDVIDLFSHLGIALLLFIIGIGLNPRVVREVGKIALIGGISQIIITSVAGFALGRLLGFGTVSALYIGVATAFSSTIIVLKLLSDSKELGRLHGKVATGFLLVQDVVAALVLIAAAGVNNSNSLGSLAFNTFVKGGLFVLGTTLIAVYVMPKLSGFFAKSQEFLFLFAIGWGLGVAALCQTLGFSVEIGALAAGVALAATPYSYEISSRMRPLRDFFIIIFFIVLGSTMTFNNIITTFIPALIISLFVLVFKPLIIMALMGILGYTKKTSFKAGVTLSQISEFSIVLVLLGVQMGQVGQNVASVLTQVSAITIAVSTYFIIYDDKLLKLFSPLLSLFERKNLRSERARGYSYDCVLFGYRGGSHKFIESFRKLSHRYLVVDFDPETIDWLTARGVPCRYGDANDSEFLDELNLDKTKLVVVNVTDHNTNNLIVNHVRYQNKKAVIIGSIRSDNTEDALELYEAGANYVMMPHHVSSERVSKLIDRHGFKQGEFNALKEKHTHNLLNESV